MQRVFRRVRDSRLKVRTDPAVAEILADSQLPPAVESALPDGSSRWAVSPESARVLAGIVLRRPVQSVLEIGAGSSSLVMASSLASKGAGRITSVEQHPQWCASQWQQIRAMANVDSLLVESKAEVTLTRLGPIAMFRTAQETVTARGPYDLVFVDAPPWRYGRDGALPLVEGLLLPGAWIVLDDARRRMERWTLLRWLRTYPALRLLHYDDTLGGRGIAILAWDGQRRPTLDALSLMTAGWHALELYRARKRRPLESPT